MRGLAGRLVLAGAILVGAAGVARGDDLSGYVEMSASSNSSNSEVGGLPPVETDIVSYHPRVNFVWTRRVFPYLQAQAGAFYERYHNTIDQLGFEQDSVTSRLRPFVRLTLRSPIALGEIGWDRNEEASRSGELPTFRLTRDTFLATAGWYPVDLPSARLELSRTLDRDSTGQFEDRTQDALRLTSDYTPIESTRLYYRGNLERDEDRIEGSSFDTISHNGEVVFSDAYFDDRWEVGGSWNTTYRRTRIESSGTGEILLSVPAVGGLFALDDTPDEGILDPSPLLVDGNELVGTTINLGLVPPAGDDRPRNVGVDLGIGRDVNVLRLWVDQDLPFEIASTFSWEIWTSDDARFWTQTATLATAPFGPFDRRFELRFPDVFTRYVKVVVRPLAPTVPNASSYPNILVTELEALFAAPASDVQRQTSDTRTFAQASSRVRILQHPDLYYETTYSLVTSTQGTTSWTLSNGLSTRHQFNRVWGVSARAAREDGLDQDRTRTAYVYTAALTADPFETLRNSLVLSGYDDDTGGIVTENRGVVLNTTAMVHDGADLNFLLGRSYSKIGDGSINDAVLIGAGATLVPYRTVTVTLRYDDRDATIAAEGAPDRQDRTQSGEAGVAYNPVPAVYLFASRRKEERTTEVDRVIDTFAFSWSPFPGGALQLSVSYNETRYSDLDEIDRSFVPFARWNLSPKSYFEVAYQALTTESEVVQLDDHIVTATLRFGF